MIIDIDEGQAMIMDIEDGSESDSSSSEEDDSDTSNDGVRYRPSISPTYQEPQRMPTMVFVDRGEPTIGGYLRTFRLFRLVKGVFGCLCGCCSSSATRNDVFGSVEYKRSEILRKIIELQSLQGYWSNAREIENVLEIGKKQVFEDVASHSMSDSIFASVLAVAALRKSFIGERTSWSLMEDKCLKWLASQGVDAEDLVSRAQALMP
jgi:hypothetical protein